MLLAHKIGDKEKIFVAELVSGATFHHDVFEDRPTTPTFQEKKATLCYYSLPDPIHHDDLDNSARDSVYWGLFER